MSKFIKFELKNHENQPEDIEADIETVFLADTLHYLPRIDLQ